VSGPLLSRCPSRRALTGAGLLLPVGLLAACSDPVPEAEAAGAGGGSGEGSGGGVSDGGGETEPGQIDTSGSQELIRSTPEEAVAALLPSEIAGSGTLRVGIGSESFAPLSFLADDNETYIGSEVDTARLVADKLGLDLEIKLTSWDNWPLKLEAGDFDVVHFNVGVNTERLEKFDFASYRAAYVAFLVTKGSDLGLGDADSISGRIIAVGAATNQERILIDWNAELEAAGKPPATLKNYSSSADTLLALGSGRVDASFGPYATQTFIASRRDDVEVQGRVEEGWPDKTLIAATFDRGSGFAEPYAAALNAVIADGTYAQVLERWNLADVGLPEARVHTKEKP